MLSIGLSVGNLAITILKNNYDSIISNSATYILVNSVITRDLIGLIINDENR